MKDDVIYEVALQRPRTADALAKLRSVNRGFERSRLGQAVLSIVDDVVQRPEDALPELPKRRPSIDGGNAAVELMKVLLKLAAEQHGVASKVIATVDDLEAIVAGDDSPALSGWRRSVFGEDALRLKAGEIAIAFDGRALKTIDCERPVNPVPAGGGSGGRGRRRRRKGAPGTDPEATSDSADASPSTETDDPGAVQG